MYTYIFLILERCFSTLSVELIHGIGMIWKLQVWRSTEKSQKFETLIFKCFFEIKQDFFYHFLNMWRVLVLLKPLFIYGNTMIRLLFLILMELWPDLMWLVTFQMFYTLIIHTAEYIIYTIKFKGKILQKVVKKCWNLNVNLWVYYFFRNGYKFLYLSSRGISQSHMTKSYINWTKQDGRNLPYVSTLTIRKLRTIKFYKIYSQDPLLDFLRF